MAKTPNVLFLVLDAFRHDLFSDMEDARVLLPNLAALVDRGIERRVVSNGMITKVAMAPLLTQTYPLDYGGYNDVVASRPASFIELLREAGYSTYMLISHCITGPIGQVERGADQIDSVWDHHMILEMYFNHVLNHELALWMSGERDDGEIAARISGEMDELLAYIEGSVDRLDDGFLPSRLRKLSPAEARRYGAERVLIRRDPLAVARKIRDLPAKMYRHYLGHAVAGRFLGLRVRLDASRAFVNRLLQFATRQPLQVFPGYVAPVASEVRRIGERFIIGNKGPWFALLHFMDAHDYKRMNRPLNFINKLRFLPRLWRIKRMGKSARDPFYDLSAAYLDSQVGVLMRQLERNGQTDDLVVVGIGDHGFGWDKDRAVRLMSELGFRTHYEHIEVPFIFSPSSGSPSEEGLFDSMSVSATLLSELGIAPHPSFLGRSVFEPGRPISLVETVGRGNTDLVRRDIFFTITSETHKLMMVLEGDRMIYKRFYDLGADPRELVNLVDDDGQHVHLERLIDFLWEEREALLMTRGVRRQRASNPSFSEIR
jgi:arylsulfatase A-like enzyme